MDGFELNRTISAVLLALLIVMIASLISEALVTPQKLSKNVYIVEGVEQPQQATLEPKEKDIEPIEPLLAAANVENGKKISQKCHQCHNLEKGMPNRIGPDLWGIVKRKMAQMADFAYSNALKTKKDIWTFENLNHFLYRPRSFIPGTKMTFIGLNKAQDRADLIAYLNTLSDSPQSLPSKPQARDKK